nr:hypothetical protein [Fodinicola feengrottensis]
MGDRGPGQITGQQRGQGDAQLSAGQLEGQRSYGLGDLLGPAVASRGLLLDERTVDGDQRILGDDEKGVSRGQEKERHQRQDVDCRLPIFTWLSIVRRGYPQLGSDPPAGGQAGLGDLAGSAAVEPEDPGRLGAVALLHLEGAGGLAAAHREGRALDAGVGLVAPVGAGDVRLPGLVDGQLGDTPTVS